MPVSRSENKRIDFVSSTLEKIRRQFDPGFSYIIFERGGEDGEDDLGEVVETLNRLELPLIELKGIKDRERGLSILIAKFDTARTDRIMEEIIGAGLPRNVIVYGYGSSQSG